MKQMGKWLVTAVLALLMMIPAVLAEETASFMTLTVPTTAQEIDLGQNVVTDYDALCCFLDEEPEGHFAQEQLLLQKGLKGLCFLFAGFSILFFVML